MKLKTSNWLWQNDPVTGKSVFLPFTETEFAVIFDQPKPVDGLEKEHVNDPGTNDLSEWDVPFIYQFRNIKTDFPFIDDGALRSFRCSPITLSNEFLLWHIRENRMIASMLPHSAAIAGSASGSGPAV